jgi:hypothetical protein
MLGIDTRLQRCDVVKLPAALEIHCTMVTGSETTGSALRRSTRVPAEIRIRVRSLDPAFQFEDWCKTLLVNAQGCGFQCPRQLPVGIAILITIDDRKNTATVLNATALGEGSSAWVIGARLHSSGNFWGLPSPPADWAAPAAAANPAIMPASADKYIEEKVTAEIQRRSEQTMAGLREQVEKLLAERENIFLARVVRESSLRSEEMARRAAEHETTRLQEACAALAAQFRRDLEHHMEHQTAQMEERLKQAQLALTASGEARVEAVSKEIVETMQQDARRLSESAIAQWHAAFEQTLQTLPELVRENLRHNVTPDPGPTQH